MKDQQTTQNCGIKLYNTHCVITMPIAPNVHILSEQWKLYLCTGSYLLILIQQHMNKNIKETAP